MRSLAEAHYYNELKFDITWDLKFPEGLTNHAMKQRHLSVMIKLQGHIHTQYMPKLHIVFRRLYYS